MSGGGRFASLCPRLSPTPKGADPQPMTASALRTSSLDGCSLERAAPPIRQPLLAPPAGVGSIGSAPGAVADVFGPAQRPTEDPLGRVLGRWRLRPRQEGEAKVGKTKQGEGMK